METINNPFAEIDSRLKSIESTLATISAKETPQIEKRFYPVSQAAEKLGVAQITIYRGLKDGRIPSKKVGSRILVPGSFVDR